MWSLLVKLALFGVAAAQQTQCGSSSLPPLSAFFTLGSVSPNDCPTVDSQISGGLGNSINTCLQSDDLLQCVYSKYGNLQPANDAMETIYSWGDSSRMSAQMNCEWYAILMDCVKASTVSCSTNVLNCFQEWCKPDLSLATTIQAKRAVASQSICYNEQLSYDDPSQFGGCTAANTAPYVSNLPAATWRTLRDSEDAQICLCGDNRGWVDTEAYDVWLKSPCDTQQQTQAFSIPFCRIHPVNWISGLGDYSTPEVAENWADAVCGLSDALVSCAVDAYDGDGASVDDDTRQACYYGRDGSNDYGVALGQMCYSECDPDSAGILALSALLLALF